MAPVRGGHLTACLRPDYLELPPQLRQKVSAMTYRGLLSFGTPAIPEPAAAAVLPRRSITSHGLSRSQTPSAQVAKAAALGARAHSRLVSVPLQGTSSTSIKD